MSQVASVRRRAASLVLVMEITVLFFFCLAAFGLRLTEASAVIWIGLGGASAIVAAIALLPRRLGYALAWAIQIGFVGLGVLAPAMFVAGGVFVALWSYVWIVGGRNDRLAAGSAGLE